MNFYLNQINYHLKTWHVDLEVCDLFQPRKFRFIFDSLLESNKLSPTMVPQRPRSFREKRRARFFRNFYLNQIKLA